MGFPAKDLILKIKGYEYCKWDEVRYEKIDEQNSRKVIDYHEGEKEFFKKIVLLYQVNAQYIFMYIYISFIHNFTYLDFNIKYRLVLFINKLI